MSLIDFKNSDHRFAYWKAVSDHVKQRLHAKARIIEGKKFSTLKDLYEHFGTEATGKQWGRQTTPPPEFIEFLHRLYPDELDDVAARSRAPEMRVILLEREVTECRRELREEVEKLEREFDARADEYRARVDHLEEQNKKLMNKLLES